jgi:glutamine amidotransferase
MIAVVDYGMGNLRSVAKALERVGATVEVTSDAETLASADGVVLPGVGAFNRCMQNLRAAGLEQPVRDAADSGKPFLGICVGMQILFESSDEFGASAGLGILPGRVRRFERTEPGMKIPHMGWNTLDVQVRTPMLRGVVDGDFVYFVHSYYVETPDSDIVATTTPYGVDFVSSVSRKALFATQFHPEKSQAVGCLLLENFARIAVAS